MARLARWMLLACLTATCLLLAGVAHSQTGVQYIYDENGRLAGVIDLSGNAAAYNYDAVGNLVSITRYTASQTSVILFTPQSGPVGTTVTIYGTGFSSTASQDSVNFNGTASTVTSATGNQITTSVPTGATTGPISVSTLSGSFTTTIPFTVTASNGKPTITSFSPQSGTPGTAVTITGTNFDPNPANDRVELNITRTFATTATTAQIGAMTPTSGSGHIVVTTPNGQAVSSQDFYVPFGAHAAADIGFTARTSFGNSENVSLASGKIALLLFDATAGQSVSLQMSASTFPSCTIYIFGPTGTQLALSTCTSSYTYVSSTILPLTGTYTIGVDSLGSAGSLTVGLTSDIGQAITANGAPVQLTMVAGQSGKLTFAGSVGELATVQVSGNTAGTLPVSLVSPSGTVLSSASNSAATFLLPAVNLPASGTYTIAFGPVPQAGNVSFSLVLAPAGTAPPVRASGSFLDPGNALSTKLAGLFVMNEGSGTTDQNLTDGQVANFSGSTLPVWTGDPSVSFAGGASLNSYMDAGTDLNFDQLPTSQMTIVAKVYVNALAAAGIAEKNDNNSSAGFEFGWDSTGALTMEVVMPSTDMKVATTSAAITPGQWIQVAFTWDGTSGTALASNAHLFINGVEQPKAISINGVGTIGYANATNKPFRIGNASFDTTAGSLNGKMAYLAVYRGRILTPAELSQMDSQVPIDNTDVNEAIVPNGSPVTATTTTPGQKIQLKFNGIAEQRAIVQLTNNTIGSVTVSLLNPDRTVLASVSSSASSFALPQEQLTFTGVYTIYVQPSGSTSGNITVGLTILNTPSRPVGSIEDPSSSLAPGLVGLFLMNEGSGTTDLNVADGQTAAFSGTNLPTWNTSDPSIVFNGGASLNSYLNAGTDLAFDQLPTSQITIVTKVYVNTLAAGGIAEKNDGSVAGFAFGWDSTGAVNLIVFMPGTNLQVATAGGVIQAGEWVQVAFTWDGTSGSALASNAHLFINGIEQAKAIATNGGGTIGYTTATYKPFRIGNASYGGISGSLNGKMAYLAVYKGRILTAAEMNQMDAAPPIPVNSNDLVQTIAPNASPVTVTTTSPGQKARLLFIGEEGQIANVQLSNNTIGSATISLLKPDNTTVLNSVTSSASSFNLPGTWLPESGVYTISIQPTGSTNGNITVGLTVSSAPSRPAGSIEDPSSSLAPGLVGLFLMNEGSGTTDLNVADGQAAAFSGTSLPTWNTSDPSIVFNGGTSLNSYLNAGTDLAFDQLPTSQITIVAKVYVNSVSAGGVAEKDDGGSSAGFAFGWDSTGALTMGLGMPGANLDVATAGGVIQAGQWIQVAFTWDGTSGNALASNAHLFVNGVEQAKAVTINGTGTIGYANATYKPFRIGNASFGSIAGSLNGKIAYLAVYKGRILTTTEMNQIDAAMPIPVNSSDLVQTITPNASPIGVTTMSPGQKARLLFIGGFGQEANIQLSNNTIGSVTISLLEPDNTTVLNSGTSSASSFSVPLTWLPQSGVYTISIQPTGSTDGSISVAAALTNTPPRPAGAVEDTSNPLSTDLMGLFLMNEGSGTTDLNVADGQTAAFSGTSLPTWNTSDPSIVFNGGSSLNSYLNAGADLAFDQLPTSKVTIVAKVYVGTLAAGGIAEKNDGNSQAGFLFGWDSGGTLVFEVETTGSNMRVATASGPIQAGQWVQVAFTWDGTGGTALGSNAHLFINGVEQAKATSQDGNGTLGYANATNKPFRIGNASFDSIAGSLNGKVAYLAVYRGRILTTTEMNQLDAQLPIH